MLICLIKVHSNLSSSVIYGNAFTKIFKKEGIDMEGEFVKFKMRQNYDVYNKKNLGVIHVVYINRV